MWGEWVYDMRISNMDYYAYISRLRGVNAKLKVTVSIIALLCCILANNIWVSVYVIITMALISVFAGKLPMKKYFSFLMIPIAFMIMGSIAIAIDFSRHPMAGGWNLPVFSIYFCITRVSLGKALLVIGKALGAVSALYMLTLSTPANEIVLVLRSLHIPKLIIELMNMIYRFIFIMLDTQSKMYQAAQSRLGYVDFRTSVKTFGSTAGNLLIVSLRKANVYYDALESRCYDGELLFLEEEKKVKGIQIIESIFYFVILGILWCVSKYGF